MIDPYTIRYGALRLSSVTLPKDAQLVGDVLTFEQLGEYYMYCVPYKVIFNDFMRKKANFKSSAMYSVNESETRRNQQYY